MNFTEMIVWVEPEDDGTYFIACEYHYPDDLIINRFGTIVLTSVTIPTEIEALFEPFRDHGDACRALREFVASTGAL